METQLIEQYKPRVIEFNKLIAVKGWHIKIYSITNRGQFESSKIAEQVFRELPKWINEAKNSKLITYKTAFLIMHEAREGVWILFNWWTGGEMIETKVYFSNYNEPTIIKESPYNTSSLLCVWELEVFAHERKAWIEHVLLKANSPKFKNYLKDTL